MYDILEIMINYKLPKLTIKLSGHGTSGIMKRWNIGESKFHNSIIPTFHVYNEILMPEGFQPSIIEKIRYKFNALLFY